MDQKLQQEALDRVIRKKFKGHQRLKSKTRPAYPEALEREYRGITDSYMKLVNQVVSKHLPEIRAAIQEEQKLDPGVRSDDLNGLMTIVQKAFNVMGQELEVKTNTFSLYRKLENLSKLTTKLSISQWKRMVRNTLGLDLFEDYYAGQFYQQMMDAWVDQNVALIKTIPQETLGQMRETVYQGYLNGKPTSEIVKEIEKAYQTNKSHARLIARDQIAKLNAELAQKQQTDAGVEEYTWSDSGDGRVRERHRELHGKRFRWDDPPVVDEKTGRRCHPGEDYQCRCVAIPVFDISTLDIPVATSKGASGKGGD